jgi:hypothetical protein
MYVHVVHDLGQAGLVEAYAPLTAACGREMKAAHEVARPESEADFCEGCLSWMKRNRYQNFRCAVEMRARGGAGSGRA